MEKKREPILTYYCKCLKNEEKRRILQRIYISVAIFSIFVYGLLCITGYDKFMINFQIIFTLLVLEPITFIFIFAKLSL